MLADRKSRAVVIAVLLVPSLLAALVGGALFVGISLELEPLRPPRSLAEAIDRGSKESVLRILSAGADPNLSIPYRHPKLNEGRKFQATALTIAAAKGDLSVVQLVLDTGIDLKDAGNEQALCAAVALGHGNVQDFLIEQGADPNPRPKCDGGRRSPLRIALDLGLYDPAERLRAAGALLDY